MRYEELLDVKRAIEKLERDMRSYNVDAHEYVTVEELVTAIQCIDKQIPKKADCDADYWECPTCGGYHEMEEYPICCPDCGQRLDFGFIEHEQSTTYKTKARLIYSQINKIGGQPFLFQFKGYPKPCTEERHFCLSFFMRK